MSCLQHETFIAARLVISLAATILLPASLALYGTPTPWLVGAYACLLTPLLSVIVAARTGRLVVAQSLWLAGLSGFVCLLALRAGALAPALAWLVLVPMESLLTLDIGLLVASTLFSATMALFLAIATAGGLVTPAASPVAASLLVIPAIAYGGCIVAYALRMVEARRRLADVGAAHYESLAETIGDLLMRHDRSGAVLHAGRNSETLFGLSPREITGRGFFERLHVGDRPVFLKALSDAATRSETVSAVLRLRTSSVPSRMGDFEEPVFRWVELRARRIDHGGDEVTIGSLVRDITSLKEHEAQAEEGRRESERSAAWKDRFLATVSHELRTPLNAIIGFSEMLANEELAPREPAKQREYAQIINGSGQHLLSVVNSILDMSKIEAGRFDICPEAFAVAPLVDSCVDMVRLKAEQGGIEIVRAVHAGADELVADKRACKQILINLLSNAVKFTKPGGSVVVGTRAEGNSLALFVSDTGIGIQALDLPHLGDAFFQARNSYDRPFEGTGLGLSVVRGLVGLHGGSISIESAPDHGTCVTVRLPLDCRASVLPPVGSARIETIARPTSSPADAMFKQPAPVKKIA